MNKAQSKTKYWIVFSGLLLLTLAMGTLITNTTKATVLESSENLKGLSSPLFFVENKGQNDSQIKFLGSTPEFTSFFRPDEVVIRLNKYVDEHEDKKELEVQGLPVSMKMVGANPNPKVFGVEPLKTKINYAVKKITGAKTYRKVCYEQVYPGIDMVFYYNGKRLEYDFIVAPGVDPNIIQMEFEGQDKLEIDEDRSLLVHIQNEILEFKHPFVYQEENKKRQEVHSDYLLDNKTQKVSFQLASYDTTKTLVIDPKIIYSTFHGGTGSSEAYGVATDGDGHAYVTGYACASDFPRTKLPTRVGMDAYVSKFDETGQELLYSTYLGISNDPFQSGQDSGGWATGIAVDSKENAYICGNFEIDDEDAFDIFVIKLDQEGNQEFFRSFDSSDIDYVNNIAVNSRGEIWICGSTDADDFTIVGNAFQTEHAGNSDGFVMRLSSSGVPLFSSYVGGNDMDGLLDLAIDSDDNVYLFGGAYSQDDFLPNNTGFQTAHGGEGDGFVLKLDRFGTPIVSTYFGGAGEEVCNDDDTSTDDFTNGMRSFWRGGIAIDDNDDIYIAGTVGEDVGEFPATSDALKSSNLNDAGGNQGGTDGFVAKMDSDLSELIYSTLFGGSDAEFCNGIAVNPRTGEMYIVGSVAADNDDDAIEDRVNNFPLVNEFQSQVLVDREDDDQQEARGAFIAKINASGQSIAYSSFLSGSFGDFGFSVATDTSGDAYFVGFTSSPNFPTVRNIGEFKKDLQQDGSSIGGDIDNFHDSFVVKVSSNSSLTLEPKEVPLGKTSVVLIKGTNCVFDKTAKVDFGSGVTLNNYRVIDSETIEANITVAKTIEANSIQNVSVHIPAVSSKKKPSKTLAANIGQKESGNLVITRNSPFFAQWWFVAAFFFSIAALAMWTTRKQPVLQKI